MTTVPTPVAELTLSFDNESLAIVQFATMAEAEKAETLITTPDDYQITIQGICNRVTFKIAHLVSFQFIDCARHRALAQVVQVQAAMDSVALQRASHDAFQQSLNPPSVTN